MAQRDRYRAYQIPHPTERQVRCAAATGGATIRVGPAIRAASISASLASSSRQRMECAQCRYIHACTSPATINALHGSTSLARSVSSLRITRQRQPDVGIAVGHAHTVALVLLLETRQGSHDRAIASLGPPAITPDSEATFFEGFRVSCSGRRPAISVSRRISCGDQGKCSGHRQDVHA